MKKLFLILIVIGLMPMIIGARRWIPRQAAAASGPAWEAETDRIQASFTASGTTKVFTLTTGMAVGKVGILIVFFDDTSVTVSSVSDSRGNTYESPTNTTGGQTRTAITAVPITTALQAGDTITVTFSGTWSFINCGMSFNRIGGVTGGDTSGTLSDFGDTPTVSLTTTAASVVMCGIATNNTGTTLTSADGTQVGSSFNWVGGSGQIIYKNSAASGSVSIGGVLSSSFNFREVAKNVK